jgi:hypothetical protein
MRLLSRRSLTAVKKIFAVLILCVAMQSTTIPSAGGADASVIGSWTGPFNLGVKGIHAQVLHNGKVLLFSYPRYASTGTEARLWNPASGAITNVSHPVAQRDMFCAGQSMLPDGRILLTGGHVRGTLHGEGRGVKENDIFNPATNTWTSVPPLTEARWYPTNVGLANGKTLIFAGQKDASTPSNTVESYDPASNTITTLPESATKKLPLYPRLHLTPSGKIFMAGPQRGTQYFNPATNSWSWVGNMSVARNNGSSVLLPGLNKVLALGGNTGSGITATAEIIDLSAAKPTWRPTGSMNLARMHSNAVLLPDGTVLVVGGGTNGLYGSPVKDAEIFDPVSESWTRVAAQATPRIYHSTAVLLPDGRVLSAGMDNGSYQFTGEVYSPPYLFEGPRPTITSAPSSLGYNQSFQISTPDAANLGRVALMKPGSATHSMDSEQRYVDLSFSAGDGAISATSPADGNKAPPGWYMLFIVSSSGVPSVASWVHLT